MWKVCLFHSESALVWKKEDLLSWVIVAVELLSHVQLFATPWTAVHQDFLSFTISQSLLKFMSIELVMPSSHLVLCHTLLLLPPIPPSIRVFSNESTLLMRRLKYWSFSFSISPSKEIPGLISFRMDWLDLLAVQGTLKSYSSLFDTNSKAPPGLSWFIVISFAWSWLYPGKFWISTPKD